MHSIQLDTIFLVDWDVLVNFLVLSLHLQIDDVGVGKSLSKVLHCDEIVVHTLFGKTWFEMFQPLCFFLIICLLEFTLNQGLDMLKTKILWNIFYNRHLYICIFTVCEIFVKFGLEFTGRFQDHLLVFCYELRRFSTDLQIKYFHNFLLLFLLIHMIFAFWPIFLTYKYVLLNKYTYVSIYIFIGWKLFNNLFLHENRYFFSFCGIFIGESDWSWH